MNSRQFETYKTQAKRMIAPIDDGIALIFSQKIEIDSIRKEEGKFKNTKCLIPDEIQMEFVSNSYENIEKKSEFNESLFEESINLINDINNGKFSLETIDILGAHLLHSRIFFANESKREKIPSPNEVLFFIEVSFFTERLISISLKSKNKSMSSRSINEKKLTEILKKNINDIYVNKKYKNKSPNLSNIVDNIRDIIKDQGEIPPTTVSIRTWLREFFGIKKENIADLRGIVENL